MRIKGKPILDVKIQKALYGLLCRALFFYKKLMKDIQAYGFQINPHNPCVENNMINDKHMTVVWHIYDLKLSHVDSFEINEFAGYTSSIYVGLTAHRGKVHDYLGIELDYIKQGTVKVYMIKYLDSVLKESPEDFGVTSATLASEHLFKVRNESKIKYLLE